MAYKRWESSGPSRLRLSPCSGKPSVSAAQSRERPASVVVLSRTHLSGIMCLPLHVRRSASMQGVSVTNCIGPLQPTKMPICPCLLAPIPRRPHWVSGPPDITGVPLVRPVSSAAEVVTSPVTTPEQVRAGIRPTSMPNSVKTESTGSASDTGRSPTSVTAERSPLISPESRNLTQSPMGRIWAILSAVSGALARNQASLAGANRKDGV